MIGSEEIPVIRPNWRTFEANQARIAHNTWRTPEGAGAAREGQALLQGLIVCGRCGRKLKVHYDGHDGQRRHSYHCRGAVVAEGRGGWCLRVGGGRIDEAVAGALLAALSPAGVKAALIAAESLEADHDQALEQWRLQVERGRYDAQRAERRYRQVEPEHRLVARGLERDWEQALGTLAEAEAELARRERARPRTLSDNERGQLPISVDGSVATLAPKAADGLRTSHVSTVGVDFAANSPISPLTLPLLERGSAQAAPTAVKGRDATGGLSDLRFRDILADSNINNNTQTTEEPT